MGKAFILAQTPPTNSLVNPASSPGIQNLFSGEFFSKIIQMLINFFLIVGAIIFLVILIFGAIQWITSGGDKMANEGARKRVTNALVGVIILFTTFGVINLVEYLFNIQLTSFHFEEFNILPGPPEGGGSVPTPSCQETHSGVQITCRSLSYWGIQGQCCGGIGSCYLENPNLCSPPPPFSFRCSDITTQYCCELIGQHAFGYCDWR